MCINFTEFPASLQAGSKYNVSACAKGSIQELVLAAGRELLNFQACFSQKVADSFNVRLSITNSETKKDCITALVF